MLIYETQWKGHNKMSRTKSLEWNVQREIRYV